MTWATLIYNNVQKKIIEFTSLNDDEPVRESFFVNLEINGELDGYYICPERVEPCRWDEKSQIWQPAPDAPDEVKLTRLILE